MGTRQILVVTGARPSFVFERGEPGAGERSPRRLARLLIETTTLTVDEVAGEREALLRAFVSRLD